MTAARGGAAYRGTAHWIEVIRNDLAFMGFLAEVADLLERPTPPDPGPDCAFCAYLLDGVLGILGNWLRSEAAEATSGKERGKRPRPHLELVTPLAKRPRAPRNDETSG
jgi:hypothetical protein